MNLNHLNLTVTDAAETAAFLRRYFGMRSLPGGPADSATMAFLTDDAGMILSLFRGKRDAEPVYPANFHIGFAQPSAGAVDEINRRLREDGYDVPEPSEQHGCWTFYFKAPGGFTVEVLS
jgi:catechol 2,3-dioxygenase-like lactoylglutathione lyase family enzyme